MKKLYGIGVGPGDPDLLTIKAHNLIRSSDYVFVPSNRGESMAATIAAKYLMDKKVIEIEFPMGEDNTERYIDAASRIDQTLVAEGMGVFLTLGDPLVYSTYIYLMAEADKLGIKTYAVPGITSFSAAASALALPLTLKDESFYLCDGNIDEEILTRVDSVAILKVSRNREEIIEKLENHNFIYYYISKCTQENQRILYDKAEILMDREYMALIIGRRK